MESHEEHHEKAAATIFTADPKTARAAARNWIISSACLLATTLAGVALMVFWVVSFHRDNEQMWMVPVSLIMVVTPVLVWFSAASDSYLHKTRAPVRPTPADAPAAVVPLDRDPEMG